MYKYTLPFCGNVLHNVCAGKRIGPKGGQDLEDFSEKNQRIPGKYRYLYFSRYTLFIFNSKALGTMLNLSMGGKIT